MPSQSAVKNVAREVIRDKTEEMEKRAEEFSLWLQDTEDAGGITGREADQLRQRLIAALR